MSYQSLLQKICKYWSEEIGSDNGYHTGGTSTPFPSEIDGFSSSTSSGGGGHHRRLANGNCSFHSNTNHHGVAAGSNGCGTHHHVKFIHSNQQDHRHNRHSHHSRRQ